MDRREMIGSAAAGVAAVCVGGVVAGETVAAQEGTRPELRAVWRWHEPTKEWIRCRMDTLKPGETCSVEEEPGSDKRYVGKVASHPRYVDGGVCEIMFTGELVTV